MDTYNAPVPEDVDLENDGSSPDRPITNVVPPKKPHNRRKWLLTTVIVVIVAALIVIGFLLFGQKRAAAPAVNSSAVQKKSAPKLSVPDQTEASGTSEYTSPAGNFNLSFSYPSSWAVAPASGQSAQTITATSPLVSITDAAGTSVPGKIVLTIRPGGSNMTELGSGQAVVAQNSVQYAYNSPTAAQHHYFYVSFVHRQDAAVSSAGAFEEVVITGINSLTKGSVVSANTFGSVDPLVTASFSQCSTNGCSGSAATPLSINAAAWQSDPNLTQLQTIFASFKFN